MERNFETVMIEQCAPVLAGLKPAGLFRYETRDCADLARRVRSWNEQLASKGLSVRVLKGCVRTHQFLIYVYREARLRAIFTDEAVRSFLAREGYQLPQEQEQTGIMLTQLSRRLCCSAEFPHEIGNRAKNDSQHDQHFRDDKTGKGEGKPNGQYATKQPKTGRPGNENDYGGTAARRKKG